MVGEGLWEGSPISKKKKIKNSPHFTEQKSLLRGKARIIRNMFKKSIFRFFFKINKCQLNHHGRKEGPIDMKLSENV